MFFNVSLFYHTAPRCCCIVLQMLHNLPYPTTQLYWPCHWPWKQGSTFHQLMMCLQCYLPVHYTSSARWAWSIAASATFPNPTLPSMSIIRYQDHHKDLFNDCVIQRVHSFLNIYIYKDIAPYILPFKTQIASCVNPVLKFLKGKGWHFILLICFSQYHL